ncbi:MAG: hypothetical protein NZ866_02840 [Patescibacteria group bacterium]|nr:hypothetical protein [Patescibacteria group bacterium]
MNKNKLYLIIFNTVIIVFIIIFFTFIFIKNFKHFGSLFSQPTLSHNQNEEINQLIKELEKKINIYLKLKDSAN